MAAAAGCSFFYGLTMTVLGPEWKPSSDEHSANLVIVENYLRAKGHSEISPELALLLGLVSYGGPRMTMPKTLSRIQKVKMWIAEKRAERKGRKQAAEIERIERNESETD